MPGQTEGGPLRQAIRLASPACVGLRQRRIQRAHTKKKAEVLVAIQLDRPTSPRWSLGVVQIRRPFIHAMLSGPLWSLFEVNLVPEAPRIPGSTRIDSCVLFEPCTSRQKAKDAALWLIDFRGRGRELEKLDMTTLKDDGVDFSIRHRSGARTLISIRRTDRIACTAPELLALTLQVSNGQQDVPESSADESKANNLT